MRAKKTLDGEEKPLSSNRCGIPLQRWYREKLDPKLHYRKNAGGVEQGGFVKVTLSARSEAFTYYWGIRPKAVNNALPRKDDNTVISRRGTRSAASHSY